MLWTAGSQPASKGNDFHSAPDRPGISLPFPRNGRVSSGRGFHAHCGHTMSARLSPVLMNLHSMPSCLHLAALGGQATTHSLLSSCTCLTSNHWLQVSSPTIARMHCLMIQGAAETDETLRVLSHSRVFALGDVSGVKSMPETDSLPITAQARASDVLDALYRVNVSIQPARHVTLVARLMPDSICLTSCSRAWSRWLSSRQTMWPGTCGPPSTTARCCHSGASSRLGVTGHAFDHVLTMYAC